MITDLSNFNPDAYTASFLKSALAYVELHSSRNQTAVFDLDHLALLTGLHRDAILSMSRASGKFYRSFKIPKKSGSFRSIVAPLPSLSYLQRWILDNVLSGRKPHFTSHAFSKNRSIKTNAIVHKNAKNIVKFDIEDFYPSISRGRVHKLFINLGYTPRVSHTLSKICTLHGTLPQGSPTSPAISNLCMEKFDQFMFDFSQQNGMRYSRYADDIVVSNFTNLPLVKDTVKLTLQNYGFKLNSDKTRIYKEGSKAFICGLQVLNGIVRVPRAFRRELRKNIHFLLLNGPVKHLLETKFQSDNYIQRIQGQLAFLEHIEGVTPEVTKLRADLKTVLSRYTD